MLRTPQIVVIEPDLIKELMISNFKHFVNNEFAYHVCILDLNFLKLFLINKCISF